jgi:hypothetical protein
MGQTKQQAASANIKNLGFILVCVCVCVRKYHVFLVAVIVIKYRRNIILKTQLIPD